MAPKLYWHLASPPARAVAMCAKELGVELELIEVDLLNKEQCKPEFLEMNPTHTIPVIDDNGFIVSDSHAIMAYLVVKYGKGSSLYPEDIMKRAIVDQMLYFDNGTLFGTHIRICVPILYNGMKTIPETSLKNLTEAYDFLDTILKNREYVAGNDMTIADFSIWTTITNSSVYLPVDEKKYPNITVWLQRMQKTPHDELNKAGRDLMQEIFNSMMS